MEDKKEAIDKSQIYEVGYLLLPNISMEEIPAIYTSLKDMVVSFGGEVISDEIPKMIPLAYAMSKVIQNTKNKYDSAYFGWFKFDMARENVLEFKKKLNLEQNVLRFLILKTVRENTIAAKRFMHKDIKKRISSKKDGEVDSTPINGEEIDKEIDAMVS